MRRTLVRTLVVALVAAVAVLPGGAARATTGSLLGPITQIYGTLAGGGQPAQVVRQVVTAVGAIRAEVLTHVGQVSHSGIRTCANRHVVEFAGIQALGSAAAQAWAQDATACVSLINSQLQALQVTPPQPTPVGPADNRYKVDLLGLVLNVVGPIALTARLHAGLGNSSLRQVLVTANTTVVAKIQPWCSEQAVYEDDSNLFELWFVCYAFNYTPGVYGRAEAAQGFLLPPGCEPWHGCQATPASPPVDKDRVRFDTMKHSSWVIARAALPLL